MELTLDKIKLKTIDEKPCQVKISVQIPVDLVQGKEREVTDVFQKSARLSGFRAGKAPVELVKQTFSERIRKETLEELLRESIPAIIKERELHPIGSPVVDQMSYAGGTPFSFNLIVERSPQFKVKNYKGIPAEKKIRKITEEDLARELESLRERNSELVPSKSEKAEKKHFAVISYTASADGQTLKELCADNQLMDLSQPQAVEGFTDGILNLSRGEAKDVSVNMPKDHPDKKLAGKSVVFHITLLDIKEKVLPTLDDDLAKDFGWESLEELKHKIMESLKHGAENQLKTEMERQILDHLTGQNPIPVPESLVSMQLEEILERSLAQYRVEKDKLEETKKTLREKIRPQAEKQVRISYLLNWIETEEKIQASDEDLKAELEKAQASNPGKKETVEHYFTEHRSGILSRIRDDKAMKFLLEHAKIKEMSE